MFTEFAFPRELTEPLGLQPAKLHNLGQLVVLVGPNGAGKSRYLQLTEKIIEDLRELGERIDLLQSKLNPPKGIVVGIPGYLERELQNSLVSRAD
jgi:energy-coupling factor transporter ATP-binding protein EcfA2